MSDPETDSVFVLSSGLPRRCPLLAALHAIRESNFRALPLHVIGVECESRAELDLRKLAEDNHSSFRHKRFGAVASEQDLVARSLGEGNEKGDDRLTIAAQMSIIQILVDEQEHVTVDWLEEQKCANRLLFCTESQQGVATMQHAQEAYQRAMLERERRAYYGQSQSGLQQLCRTSEDDSAVPLGAVPPKGFHSDYLKPGAERWRVAEKMEKAQQRSGSQRAFTTESLRKPSGVNPWDVPGETTVCTSKLRTPGRGNRPRPPRARPSSASRAGTRR